MGIGLNSFAGPLERMQLMEGVFLEIRGEEGVRRVPLDETPVTVGRHPDNVAVLADKRASRFHCVVEKVPGGWRVRDLKSANGTRVDGQLITSSLMSPGRPVVIGNTQLILVQPGEVGAVEPLDPLGQEPIETLGEEDVVESTSLPSAVFDGTDGAIDERGRIVFTSDGGAEGAERVLRDMASALPERTFDETDIALVNVRGQVVHAAGGETRQRDGTKRGAVDLVRLILLVCFRSRASDIHLEPRNNEFNLRIRVDGTMVDVVKFNEDLGVKLVALIKILSDIDVTKREIVQEGHFTAQLPDRRVDFRLSFAPTVFGQKLVMRILDAASAPLLAKDLQVPQWMLEQIEHGLELEAGMLLVCGPTGSGKTTSLYAMLRSINVAERNVVTIEDPVEIQLDGVTQLPVNDAAGKTFSALLRSVLRQDPDVILVGEIRDPETARIAMQAAITGHLVFSTVHTKDTAGTIFRLLDLGVEPYMIAQGLHLVLAQRLVRRLCPFCKKRTAPTAEQKTKMGPAAEGVSVVYTPGGCPRCLGTGFSGRRAFFELLTTTDELREAILRNPTLHDIQEALSKTRFERLQHAGYQLVAEGAVAFEEIERAVGR